MFSIRCTRWTVAAAALTAVLAPISVLAQTPDRPQDSAAQFPTRGDKAVRAQSMRGRMELTGLYVPAAAEWLPDLRAELLAFPTGKHDDIVDALGLIGQLMDKFAPGYVPKKPQHEPKSGYQVIDGGDDDYRYVQNSVKLL